MGQVIISTLTEGQQGVDGPDFNALVVPLANEFNGSIDNTNIAAGAAIAYSKLSLGGSIVNADISSSAAIAYSKLSLGTSIVNADISASAAIADSKLAQITTTDKVALSAITAAGTYTPTGTFDFSGATVTLGTIEDYGTSGTTGTAKNLSALVLQYGVRSVSGNSTATVTGLNFTSSTSYAVVTGFGTATDAVEAIVIIRDSGSQITIYNNDNQAQTVHWLAIGT